jgi:hypothetical protein
MLCPMRIKLRMSRRKKVPFWGINLMVLTAEAVIGNTLLSLNYD